MLDIAWFVTNFIAELFSPRLGNRMGAGMVFDILVCLIVTSSLLAYRRLHNAVLLRGWAFLPKAFDPRRRERNGFSLGTGGSAGRSDRVR